MKALEKITAVFFLVLGLSILCIFKEPFLPLAAFTGVFFIVLIVLFLLGLRRFDLYGAVFFYGGLSVRRQERRR